MRAVLFLLGCLAAYSAGADTSAGEAVTLAQCRALALARNAELAAAQEELTAAAGDAQQAGAWPNPELSFEAENFGGDLPGTEQMETTWKLAQRLEWPGRRAARQAAVRAEQAAAAAALDVMRLDLLAQVDRRFTALLAAQERLAIARAQAALADSLLAVVSALIEAGEVAAVEAERVRGERALAGVQAEQAAGLLARRRVELAELWGEPAPSFDRADGSLETDPLPPVVTAPHDGDAAPDLRPWDAERERLAAELKLAARGPWPDLEVSAGARRLGETDAGAFVGGFALALPLLDRGGGARTAAAARLRQAERRRQAQVHRLQAAWLVATAELESAEVARRRLRDEVLPGAEAVLAATQEGYRRGKLPLRDVLDARRSLGEARERYIEALETVHAARIELQRLRGGSAPEAGGWK